MGALTLKGVGKTFDGVAACSGINLAVEEGEFFTFLGPSGCGKTTLLRLIAGFITPDEGAIYLGDQEITHLPPEMRNVGMVFQNYALFPFLSVYQNIAYGLKVQKKKRREIRNAIETYMEMMGLSGMENRSISELSGGEQQRVALARCLVTEPRVLLLDEPLSNLDARLRDKMRLEIKSLQKRLGITTLFVTHDQAEALTLSDRLAVFDKGTCTQVGTPQKVYSSPDSAFVAQFVGETNLFDVVVESGRAMLPGGLSLELDGSKKRGRFVSIRPQDISLSATKPKGPNAFKGMLKETRLNGGWVEHVVRVGGVSFRVVALNTRGDHHPMMPGDTLFLSIPVQSISLLDR
ncbi:ABC transporter ATP-binding protein [Desulfoluna spongiiphila]|uniref:ABC transporter ATP-binding protein n=1 Tax=Desulfoluna spongiiphila TaxID=419481 RepID=UPI001259C9BD|nr:ABC transporter ATP-binding protein [Desulfoluna spongiiphila]VVS95527.1 transport-associated ob type 2 [Desulfoluna spongiiphila]